MVAGDKKNRSGYNNGLINSVKFAIAHEEVATFLMIFNRCCLKLNKHANIFD